MPHSQSNHWAADSLDEAISFLRSKHKNRQLWMILKFDTQDRYHVFHSTSNFGQQMHGISKEIFELSGHYGRGMPHGRALAQDLTNKLVMDQCGQPHGWGGHAEEHMIQHFASCLAQAPSAPANVLIWNSDTPCRVEDGRKSANLTHWPDSCSAKLNQLAQQTSNCHFTVYVRKPFGTLQQTVRTDMAKAVAILNAEKSAGNLTYEPFSDELKDQTRGI